MAKCRNCNIEILDANQYCPLCKTVLPADETLVNMYPNNRTHMRKVYLLSRIYLFSIIIIEAILVVLNILWETEIWWSVITALGLLYSYLVLKYAIIGKSGHRTKASVLVLLGVLSAIAIDFVLGYRGWSVDFMLPAGILIMDVLLVIFIFVNRRCWHSYIMWLLSMQLVSTVPIILFANNLEKYWYIAFMPAIVTTVILLGVFIIGGRRATEELRRRFHIN